jgi:hypothetical protein
MCVEGVCPGLFHKLANMGFACFLHFLSVNAAARLFQAFRRIDSMENETLKLFAGGEFLIYISFASILKSRAVNESRLVGQRTLSLYDTYLCLGL